MAVDWLRMTQPERRRRLNIIRIFRAKYCIVQPEGWDGAVGSMLALMNSIVVSCHRTSAATPLGLSSPRAITQGSSFLATLGLRRNPFGIGIRNEALLDSTIRVSERQDVHIVQVAASLCRRTQRVSVHRVANMSREHRHAQLAGGPHFIR